VSQTSVADSAILDEVELKRDDSMQLQQRYHQLVIKHQRVKMENRKLRKLNFQLQRGMTDISFFANADE